MIIDNRDRDPLLDRCECGEFKNIESTRCKRCGKLKSMNQKSWWKDQ